MSNMDQFNEYRRVIAYLASNRINVRIPNGLPQHASILIETMFSNAAGEMRIFTQELNEDVFGKPKVLQAARKFLSKPYANLSILLQRPNNIDHFKEHPLFRVFSELKDSNSLHGAVLVKNAAGSYSEDGANHFAVMDNDGFRFETDHKKCKAIANFNDSKTAKKLIAAFDSAIELSKVEPLFNLRAS